MGRESAAVLCLTAIAALVVPAASCAWALPSPPSETVEPAATCPRNAARSDAGRCACVPGQVVVLGACLPPSLGDRYCGPGAMIEVGGGDRGLPNDAATGEGCVFRPCESGKGEVRDVATGGCVFSGQASGTSPVRCGANAAVIVEDGRAECVSSTETCPRGTARGSGEAANACVRTPACPPGSLPSGHICRPIVGVGPRDTSRVDIGSWAAIVLGADEGPGSETLCRPIALRPAAFGVQRGSAMDLGVRISLFAPDQDVALVHIQLHVADEPSSGAKTSSGAGPSAKNARLEHALTETAQDVVASAIAPLIEALRGLGGESSAAAVEVTVHCAVANY